MSTDNRNRVTRGVATGGQFAPESKSEDATVSLAAPATTPETPVEVLANACGNEGDPRTHVLPQRLRGVQTAKVAISPDEAATIARHYDYLADNMYPEDDGPRHADGLPSDAVSYALSESVSRSEFETPELLALMPDGSEREVCNFRNHFHYGDLPQTSATTGRPEDFRNLEHLNEAWVEKHDLQEELNASRVHSAHALIEDLGVASRPAGDGRSWYLHAAGDPYPSFAIMAKPGRYGIRDHQVMSTSNYQPAETEEFARVFGDGVTDDQAEMLREAMIVATTSPTPMMKREVERQAMIEEKRKFGITPAEDERKLLELARGERVPLKRGPIATRLKAHSAAIETADLEGAKAVRSREALEELDRGIAASPAALPEVLSALIAKEREALALRADFAAGKYANARKVVDRNIRSWEHAVDAEQKNRSAQNEISDRIRAFERETIALGLDSPKNPHTVKQ